MIFFVTFLRALAACFITNAHYTGIYPTDLIANGGLVGDVLFFAVSGFCLCNVKFDLSVKGFARWYGKRIWRIYPSVVVITAIYMALGAYKLDDERGTFFWYVYPTNYHFVASIMTLYIPYFFIMKTGLRNRLVAVMAGIGIVGLIVYLTRYDRSFYHIDKVREPMIRFLFMESLLLGAWFRVNDAKLRNVFKARYPVVTIALFFAYFASKLLFVKREELASLQILNWGVVFVLLFFIFRTFDGLDARLEKAPTSFKHAIQFLSDLTLEIYVVQYVIVDVVRNWGLSFPLNWFVLTAIILGTAYALHLICAAIYETIDKTIVRLTKESVAQR